MPYACAKCGVLLGLSDRGESQLAAAIQADGNRCTSRGSSSSTGASSSSISVIEGATARVLKTGTSQQSVRMPVLPLQRTTAPAQGSAGTHTKPAAVGDKRKADQAELSFASVWFSSRKCARSGRQEELGSLADVLRLTATRRAKSAYHDVGGRLPGWLNRFAWEEGKHWVREVPAFRSRGGGGYQGLGLVKTSAQQVYTWCNSAS